MLIINDLHISCHRTGGTTPDSQQALRQYLRESLSKIINTEDKHVVILGDLFDQFNIDMNELVGTYEILSDWRTRSGGKLTLIQGNHDAVERAGRMSSFHTLCYFLQSEHGNNVQVIDSGFDWITPKVTAISHVPNQDLFNLAIQKALDTKVDGDKVLMLHCNIKNQFAENQDHSLNLSNDQLDALMIGGWKVICGHEHIGYELRDGRVVVIGNQFPTSVSDCIGDKEKHALRLHSDGTHEYVKTWANDGNYLECGWTDLSGVDEGVQFVRVTGDAGSGESADVIKAIAGFRQRSRAFVVANAVKIEGVSTDDTPSVEDIKSFDIMGAIMAELNEEERRYVKELLTD